MWGMVANVAAREWRGEGDTEVLAATGDEKGLCGPVLSRKPAKVLQCMALQQ